jgi:glyoxylase-like metal-dependent hydrolase (beta-lactamase superfamily II)
MARAIREVADGVVVLNYPYLNQNIGVIVGRDEVAVIDTRSSPGQAREILADVRGITRLPVRVVIDTHGHSDHAFGNATFRPATIWGQAGCPAFLELTGAKQRRDTMKELPDEAADIEALTLDPPDRLVEEHASIDVGGRPVELRFLGRGHTDHDLVIHLPDERIAFAGDLVTKSNFPFFGDAFPLDFPASIRALGDLAWDTLVTGHGGLADRDYLAQHLDRLTAIVDTARVARDTGADWRDLVGRIPLPKGSAFDGLRRALAQLDGSL